VALKVTVTVLPLAVALFTDDMLAVERGRPGRPSPCLWKDHVSPGQGPLYGLDGLLTQSTPLRTCMV
jgi:hypothetical protein